MCMDGKAETGCQNLVETGSRANSGSNRRRGPKIMHICNDVIDYSKRDLR